MTGPAHIVMGATAASCKAPLSFGANLLGLAQRTYSPRVNMAVAGVLHEAAKTRTVLHLFSEAPSFHGHRLGSRLTGADVSLQLSRFFV
jgi:hypothetical protein